jgi:hypothetical protein
VTDTVILCTDLGRDCWTCGGYVRARLGPEDDPSPDGRFCSLDCFEDFMERTEPTSDDQEDDDG